MQNLNKQHIQAQKHSHRVFVYKLILLYLSILTILLFIAITFYPYIKKMKIQTKDITKSLLGRMENTSLMITPKIVNYKNGKEVYVIEADETSQDYEHSYLLHLKKIRARFAISETSTLSLQSSKGDFYTKDKILNLPDNISMKIVDGEKTTNIKLSNAYIYIKDNKLVSNGIMQLENDNMKLQANKLTITQKGDNLLFSKGVFLSLKQNNTNVTSDQFEIKREQQQLLWHHNVEVHRGEDILKSDQLIANYSKKPNVNYYESLDNIRAYGNVYMKQNGDVALACEMYFNKKTNKSILKKCADKNQTTIFFSDKAGHK